MKTSEGSSAGKGELRPTNEAVQNDSVLFFRITYIVVITIFFFFQPLGINLPRGGIVC